VNDLKAERFLLQARIKMKKYEGRFAYTSDSTIPIPPLPPEKNWHVSSAHRP